MNIILLSDFKVKYQWQDCGKNKSHQTNTIDASIILTLCNFIKSKKVLEIGVNEGKTARMLLDKCSFIEKYIGIEVPLSKLMELQFQQNEIPKYPGCLVKNDSRFQLMLKTNGSLGLSAKDFIDKFDLIFIDGDHSEKAVRHDTKLANKIIASNGIICWHDYHLPSVSKVIDKLDTACLVEGSWLCYQRVNCAADGKPISYASQQPNQGDQVIHCGHLYKDNDFHINFNYFKVNSPIEYARPNGTIGQATWIATCDECFKLADNSITKLKINGECRWRDNQPVIYK